MLVKNQIIEVKVVSKTLKHYRNLGYNVKRDSVIQVPPEHLTNGCKSKVLVICDKCGKQKEMIYANYVKYHHQDVGDLCSKCNKELLKQSMVDTYGVEHPLHLPSFKQKREETLQKNYGVSGPLANPHLKEKAIQTNIQKYGVAWNVQNKKCIEKRNLTYLRNGSCRTSKQQIQLQEQLCSLYGQCEINVPCSNFMLDCVLNINGCKINIEYDGWYWHQDKHKDIIRDMIVKKYGYKIIRIKSAYMLPTDAQLQNTISELINSQHTFKEIILQDWKEHTQN